MPTKSRADERLHRISHVVRPEITPALVRPREGLLPREALFNLFGWRAPHIHADLHAVAQRLRRRSEIIRIDPPSKAKPLPSRFGSSSGA